MLKNAVAGLRGMMAFQVSQILRLKKPVVVVEIGNDWLKVLENAHSPKGRYVAKARFIRLAHIKGSVAETISDIFRGLKLDRGSVITYIPRHLVTVRILELPSTDPKEIKDMVDLQISKQTPYSKEEIVASHKILGSSREKYTKVMLVIAARNIINERVSALQVAGIGVEKVGLSSEGVCNWFSLAYMPRIRLQDNEALILIDIDSNYSDFMVIRKGQITFTRNIFIGANHFSGASEEWQAKFVEELKRSKERYQNEEKDARISKIFLSGASRSIEGLGSRLSAELDIPVENTHPARNIRLDKNVEVLLKEDFRSVSSTALFGAAVMRGELRLDLMPSELRIQKFMEKKRKDLTVMGILFASIVTMVSFLLLITLYNKNVYLEQVKQKIARVEKESDEIEKMRMRAGLIESRLDAKGSSIDILTEIYRVTSKEIYFVNVDIEEKQRVTLRGRAYAMSDVFEFVTTLENSPYFENVKTTHTTTKKEKGLEYADFEIICMYQRK